MSKHKGPDVRILNPFAGRGYTSKKRAERYIRRGVARWVEDKDGRLCLQFVASGASAAAIAASVARNIAYDCAAAAGMAKIRAMANLPMTSPSAALGIGRRKGATRHTFVASQGWALRG